MEFTFQIPTKIIVGEDCVKKNASLDVYKRQVSLEAPKIAGIPVRHRIPTQRSAPLKISTMAKARFRMESTCCCCFAPLK